MATGDLGQENLRRALEGFAQALAIDVAPYPDFVRDCIDSGRCCLRRNQLNRAQPATALLRS
jgi:hypothetical protein